MGDLCQNVRSMFAWLPDLPLVVDDLALNVL